MYGFDSAELVTGAYSLGIVHATGYPLYLLLGKLFTYVPWGDVAYGLNLMSATFAALTVVVVYHIMLLLTGNSFLSLASVMLFSFSYYYWHVAVVAEVYTLHLFLLAVLILILLVWERDRTPWLLPAFMLVYGLSLGNHMSGILSSFGFVYFILRVDARQFLTLKTLTLMLFAFLLGLSVYLYLPLRYAAEPPLNYVKAYYGVDLRSPKGLFWMISGQMYRFFAFGYDWSGFLSEVGRYFSYLWRNYLGIGVIIGLVGGFRQFRDDRKTFFFLWLIFATNALFFINYAVVDKDTMFLPTYLVWVLWIAIGFQESIQWIGHWVTDVTHRWAGSCLTWIPLSTALLIGLLALVLNYRWVDQSQNRTAQEFADRVFATAEPDSLVLARWSSAVVLEYFQVVEGQRPDLTVFNRSRFNVASYYKLWSQGASTPEILADIEHEEISLVDRASETRPVYLIEYDPVFAQQYEYRPIGGYYKLQRKP
ncbi:MAG: DUF2723 domain-containing protein [Anaerolineae bacterium]